MASLDVPREIDNLLSISRRDRHGPGHDEVIILNRLGVACIQHRPRLHTCCISQRWLAHRFQSSSAMARSDRAPARPSFRNRR